MKKNLLLIVDKYMDNWKFFIQRTGIIPFFPREIGISRTKIYRFEDYVNYIIRNFGKLSCYTGVYSLYQRELKIIDTILIEFDATCYFEMELYSKIIEQKMKKYGFKYRKYFSGKKGFHYYLDLDKPVRLERARKVLRLFIDRFFSLNTSCGRIHIIDTKSSGDISRIIRIPYTIHPETGFFCYRVNEKLKFSEMINPPKIEETLEPNQDLCFILKMIEKEINETEAEINRNYHSFPVRLQLSVDLAPPCIISIINELLTTGELAHEKRLHLGAFLKHVGVPLEEAIWVYSYANDFDEHKTRQQLESIYFGPYRTYSCKRAKELNMCPLTIKEMKKCGYYPWISIYLRGEKNR